MNRKRAGRTFTKHCDEPHKSEGRICSSGDALQEHGSLSLKSQVAKNHANDSILVELDSFQFIMSKRIDAVLTPSRDYESFMNECVVFKRKQLLPILQAGHEAFRQGRFTDAFAAFGIILSIDFGNPSVCSLVDSFFRNLPRGVVGFSDLPSAFVRLNARYTELHALFGLVALREDHREIGFAYLECVRWDQVNVESTVTELIDQVNLDGSNALRESMLEGLMVNPMISRHASFLTNISVGGLAFRLGRWEVAKNIFLRLATLSVMPDSWNLVRLVQGLARTGSLDVADAIVGRLEQAGDDPKIAEISRLLSLAEAYIAIRRLNAAARILSEINKNVPFDGELAVRLANCLLRSGCVSDAFVLIDKVVQVEGISQSTAPLVAVRGQLTGNSLGVLSLLEEAGAVSGEASYITYWIMYLRLFLGRFDAAAETIASLKDTGQTFSGLLGYQEAHIQLVNGDTDGAVCTLKHLISCFYPPNYTVDFIWEFHWELGIIYYFQGNIEEARKVLVDGDLHYELPDNACSALLHLIECRQTNTTPGVKFAYDLLERADCNSYVWLATKPWLLLKAAQVFQLNGMPQMACRVLEDRFLCCPHFYGKSTDALRRAIIHDGRPDFNEAANVFANAVYPHWDQSLGFKFMLAQDVRLDVGKDSYLLQ